MNTIVNMRSLEDIKNSIFKLYQLFQNNSQDMLCECSHTNSESLARIRTIVAEIQHFFLGECFYWRTLYIV